MALKKSKDKVLAGVCGGIAEALGFDKTLVRVIWAILILCAGTGFCCISSFGFLCLISKKQSCLC